MTRAELVELLQGASSDLDREANLINNGDIVYNSLQELMDYVAEIFLRNMPDRIDHDFSLNVNI